MWPSSPFFPFPCCALPSQHRFLPWQLWKRVAGKKVFEKGVLELPFLNVGVFSGLYLVKISCTVCINKLEAGLQGELIKFAYDTEFGDINSPWGRGPAARPWQMRGWGNQPLCEMQQCRVLQLGMVTLDIWTDWGTRGWRVSWTVKVSIPNYGSVILIF